MTISEDNPVDPFKNISLDDFKKEKRQINYKEESKFLDEKTIKKLAKESNFQSREAREKLVKPKIITKTFSLFQRECDIINSVIRSHLDKLEGGQTPPSGSDVVRAALHKFSQITSQDQSSLVRTHRGRGRMS
jgi:hypothetical protein